MIADEIKPLVERNLGGRPPHEPTEKTRAEVETLSGFGLKHDEISTFLGIGTTTLEKYYETELALGRVKADAKVAESLFKKATSNDHPQAATCAIWWEKTRAGRKEPKQEMAHSGAIGTFDMSKLSDEELERITAILEAAATRGADSVASGNSEAGE